MYSLCSTQKSLKHSSIFSKHKFNKSCLFRAMYESIWSLEWLQREKKSGRYFKYSEWTSDRIEEVLLIYDLFSSGVAASF